MNNIVSYEIKESRNGNLIPIINDIHLHSAYNPHKESVNLVQKHLEQIKQNNKILVFGLGFAYHVEALLNEVKKHHREFEIVVIEPNLEVFRDCLEQRDVNLDLVDIHAGEEVADLYADVKLVEFLSEKPTVIAHPASFNLYNDYFKSFITYKSANTVGDVKERLTNNYLKNYFERLPQFQDFDSSIEDLILQKQNYDHELDFFTLAFRELTNKKEPKTVG